MQESAAIECHVGPLAASRVSLGAPFARPLIAAFLRVLIENFGSGGAMTLHQLEGCV
jgi:hypothetical protein